MSAKAGRIVLYLALAVFALYFLFPLAAMLLTSFKSTDEIRNGTLFSWPHTFSFAAWQKAWSGACIGVSCNGLAPYFWNSFKIAIPAVLISTAVGALNGYVLSQWRFRGADLVFGLMLMGCFLPYQIVLIPMARFLGFVGLAGGRGALVMVHVIYGIAFTTLFFRNYYVTIPRDLIRAAKIDGAGFFTIFARIIAPLSLPITMVTMIWQFTAIWNDFLFGAVFSTGATQPLTVALNNLVNTSTGIKEYGVDMAAALIAAIPTLVVYILAGKYFVRGLTAGALKG